MAVRAPAEGGGGFLNEIKVPDSISGSPCISDAQVISLAKYAVAIESHYGVPMDIEWALDEDGQTLYIVQARPETVWAMKAQPKEGAKSMSGEKKRLLRGVPASPGLVAGNAHVILDVSSISEFQTGEILVSDMTSPDWAPAMRKAKAIVTNSGGRTCHAAIVSRELGIPCIVGTGNATSVLKNCQLITVDATHGMVYDGNIIGPEEKVTPVAPIIPNLTGMYPASGTKIYMNLGEPDMIERYRDLPFDGIGLMRIEFIISDIIGEHPLSLIESHDE